MTTAEFFKKNGKFCKFRISGHSGYGEQGSDIVCAAVSSMAFLTVNNITDSFGLNADISADEDGADLQCTVNTEDGAAVALIAGLHRELCVLAKDYPEFVRVVLK